MIGRIALGLALSGAAEHRWRRVVVPVAAAIFMLLVLAASSLIVLVRREEMRDLRRVALEATAPAPTDMLVVWRDDYWRGEQFSVNWIEAAGSATPVLPPGMSQFPEPGQAVVSPALDRLARQHPSLAARYPNRRVLEREGIRSEDELFAYVRMPEGRTLAGDERTSRIRAFGPPTSTDRFVTLGILPPTPMVAFIAMVLGLLVVPGVLVLAVGVATASSTRDHRFTVLHWLGASSRTSLILAVLETLLLALPGLIIATALWSILAPRLGQVPLVNHAVVQGDLALPAWLLLAALVVCILVTALCAALVTAVRDQRTIARPRPVVQRAAITPARVMPLAIGIGIVALGRMSADPHLRMTLPLIGIVILLVGVPLILPSMLRVVGTALRQYPSVATLISGRGLEWDSIRTARPFAGVTALVTLVIAGSAFLAVLRQSYDSEPISPAPYSATVRWFDPRPDDTARLARALGTGLVVPFEHGHQHGNEPGHDHGSNNAVVISATCSQLAAYVPEVTCRPDAPLELSDQAVQRLAALAGTPGASVRLASSTDIGSNGNALVIDDQPLDVFHERVQVAALQTLPAPTVLSPLTYALREPWLDAWIVGGLLIAVLSLTLGCVMSMVDRQLVTRVHRRHLLNLGVVPRRLALVEMWLFAAPYVASIAVSVAAGTLIAILLLYGTDTRLPWDVIGTVLGLALIIGSIGTLSVALFGARSALITRS